MNISESSVKGSQVFSSEKEESIKLADTIQKELKKHKFLNANTPIGTKQKIYFMYSDDGRITSDGYTFYVLDKEGNYNENEKYFPYYSGIAIDKNMSHILYYHIVKGD
jgi:hypothetical protein